jgi:hypothetical protein
MSIRDEINLIWREINLKKSPKLQSGSLKLRHVASRRFSSLEE